NNNNNKNNNNNNNESENEKLTPQHHSSVEQLPKDDHFQLEEKSVSVVNTKSTRSDLQSPDDNYSATFIYVNRNYIAIGDNQTYAIYIDKNLNHGTTSKCLSLKSPRLVQDVNGDFQIRHIEVWCVE
ncbi:TLD domain-containing protein, partial [Reticulomyxa filosa]